MATNYTQHYHLPQWAADDHVLRDEFNQAWADVDAGLEAAAEKPYTIGSYTGDGSNSKREFSLGFQPGAVIVSGLRATTRADHDVLNRLAICVGKNSHNMLRTSSDGFTVQTDNSTVEQWPKLNENGYQYFYIAFR